MKNIIWQDLYLERNPFSIVPNRDQKDLYWAGLETTKKTFIKTFHTLFNSSESKIILNISRWGGGKTHSSFYFSRPENIPGIEQFKINPLFLYINLPKEGNTATDEFYKLILEELSIDFIGDIVKACRTHLNNEALNYLKQISKNDVIARILWFLGDEDEDLSFEASELLFNSPSATQRKKLKLTRGLNGNSDKFRFISTIFKLLSDYDVSGKLTEKRKIFLWIDELESLMLYTSKQYVPFTQALRELVDSVSTNFYLLLNISLTDYDDLRTLEFVIGKALFDRITNKVVFEEPSLEEALDYIKDSLTYCRTDDFKNDNPYFPFNEELLKETLSTAPEKTDIPYMPRILNKWSLSILNEANEQGLFEIKPIAELNDPNIYKSIFT